MNSYVPFNPSFLKAKQLMKSARTEEDVVAVLEQLKVLVADGIF